MSNFTVTIKYLLSYVLYKYTIWGWKFAQCEAVCEGLCLRHGCSNRRLWIWNYFEIVREENKDLPGKLLANLRKKLKILPACVLYSDSWCIIAKET